MISQIISYICGVTSCVMLAFYLSRTKKASALRSVSQSVLNTLKNGCLTEARTKGSCLVVDYLHKGRKYETYLPYNEACNNNVYYFNNNNDITKANVEGSVGIFVSPNQLGVEQIIVEDFIEDRTVKTYSGDEVFTV